MLIRILTAMPQFTRHGGLTLAVLLGTVLLNLRSYTPPVHAATFTLIETAGLVINEIDYDQPGTDTAEFIELKNNGANGVNLDPYSLVLVNGNGGGAVPYQT